uniref:Uncharacterized protein n=1 Tax=viral metagenome TaxID=1070528 RepID=A0A6H1ZE21_9ZZZZ
MSQTELFQSMDYRYMCCTPADAWGVHEWGARALVRIVTLAKPAKGLMRVDAAGRMRQERSAPTNVLVEMHPAISEIPGSRTRWTRPARGVRRLGPLRKDERP